MRWLQLFAQFYERFTASLLVGILFIFTVGVYFAALDVMSFSPTREFPTQEELKALWIPVSNLLYVILAPEIVVSFAAWVWLGIQEIRARSFRILIRTTGVLFFFVVLPIKKLGKILLIPFSWFLAETGGILLSTLL